MAERRAFLWLKNAGFDVRRAGNRKMYFRVNHSGRTVDYTLVGRADYLTDDLIVEVKASRPKARYMLPYLAQLNLYMLMYEVDNGILLFGDGTFLKVRRSDFIIRQSLSYFAELAEHIRKLELPDGEPAFCNGCPFRGLY